MRAALLAPLALALRRGAFFGTAINTGMALLTGSQTSVMLACIWLAATILASQWLARLNDREGLKAA